MKVLIAIDSFKGSLASMAAGSAAAAGVRKVFPAAEILVRPLADGGEGTVAALVTGFKGEWREVEVRGPLGAPVKAHYGWLPGSVAVMEMAEAAGITLIDAAERNPLRTSTYGVGEMILDALRAGAKKIIMGIGGSATNDAGSGMLSALGFELLTATGEPLAPGGGALGALLEVRPPREPLWSGVEFRIACDVGNPLCGPQGASAVFGPQKGATPAMVAELDAALRHFAEVTGVSGEGAGDGAAGGLGFAFRNFLGAKLVPGVDLVLEETGLAAALAGVDVVITGEGRLDGQTVMGKAPIGVAKLAKRAGVKRVLAFAGCLGPGVEAVNAAGIDAYFPILRTVTSLEQALEPQFAADNLTATVEQAMRLI